MLWGKNRGNWKGRQPPETEPRAPRSGLSSLHPWHPSQYSQCTYWDLPCRGKSLGFPPLLCKQALTLQLVEQALNATVKACHKVKNILIECDTYMLLYSPCTPLGLNCAVHFNFSSPGSLGESLPRSLPCMSEPMWPYATDETTWGIVNLFLFFVLCNKNDSVMK